MTMASDTRESNFEIQYVGNKAKGRISKRVFQENKACQIFRKTNISYPLIRTRVWVAFCKIWRVLFSWNTRFKIGPFALLPTIGVVISYLVHYNTLLQNVTDITKWYSYFIVNCNKSLLQHPSEFFLQNAIVLL